MPEYPSYFVKFNSIVLSPIMVDYPLVEEFLLLRKLRLKYLSTFVEICQVESIVSLEQCFAISNMVH